jgi:hypothetical protein
MTQKMVHDEAEDERRERQMLAAEAWLRCDRTFRLMFGWQHRLTKSKQSYDILYDWTEHEARTARQLEVYIARIKREMKRMFRRKFPLVDITWEGEFPHVRYGHLALRIVLTSGTYQTQILNFPLLLRPLPLMRRKRKNG